MGLAPGRLFGALCAAQANLLCFGEVVACALDIFGRNGGKWRFCGLGCVRRIIIDHTDSDPDDSDDDFVDEAGADIMESSTDQFF